MATLGAVSVFTCSPAAFAQKSAQDHAQALANLPEEQQIKFGELLGLAQTRFEQGKFEAALTILNEAQDIYPHPRILYKMAEAYERSGQLKEAREYYQLYLDSGDATGNNKTITQGLISNLDRRLFTPATLILSSNPSDALVYLDAQPKPIGSTPLRYPLDPGEHTLTLKLKDHEDLKIDVVAKPDSELVVEKSLTASPNSWVAPPNPLDPVAETHFKRAKIIGLSSAALGATGGVLFLLANKQANILDQAIEDRQTTARPDESVTSRHNALVISAWSLSALSALGSTWSLLEWRKSRTSHVQSISVEASKDGASLSLEAVF